MCAIVKRGGERAERRLWHLRKRWGTECMRQCGPNNLDLVISLMPGLEGEPEMGWYLLFWLSSISFNPTSI